MDNPYKPPDCNEWFRGFEDGYYANDRHFNWLRIFLVCLVLVNALTLVLRFCFGV